MTDTASNDLHTLHISDPAYDELLLQARMMGYITPTSGTARGLSTYIAFLMTCDMQDIRPEEIQAQDSDLLRNGLSPEWHIYAPRVQRRLKIPEHTMIAGAAHAFRLGIAYPSAMPIKGAPCITNLTQCMSALLEAIGTEWIAAKVRQDAIT